MIEKWIQILRGYKWFFVVPFGLTVVIASFFWMGQTGHTEEQLSLTEISSSREQMGEKSESSQTETSLVVDVKGAVKELGLYHLPVGSRIHDAVKAAGGVTESADSKSINLAQKVSDESIVYVATKEEAISVVPSSTAMFTNTDKGDREGLVNLNTATEADLQTISGIGAKRASDIIAYRESNGHFQSVDDLKNVSGIGDKSLENIRPYVTID